MRTHEGNKRRPGAGHTTSAEDEAASRHALNPHSTTPDTQAYATGADGIHGDALAGLPAMRRARTLALLGVIDRDGSPALEYALLASWLVKQRYRVDGWTPAQLEQTANDLTVVGAITVSPGPSGGRLIVSRVGKAAA